MSFNILKHRLVPEHHLLTKEEAEKVMREMNIQRTDLPRIFTDDPVIRHLEASMKKKVLPGDILRIVRRSQTAGITTVYRIVSERRE